MVKNKSKEISALDENGKPVDWWFAYKIPKLGKTADKPSTTGYEYVYYDANIKKVVKSPNLLTDGKGALDLTLKSIFESKSDTLGWLLHSWPKYADPNATAMPTPMYGQTFICISLDMETASKIAAQMINHQTPQVFLPKMPKDLDKNDPLFKLSRPYDTNPKADSDVLNYKSRGGLDFKLIAKNRKWNKDFWNDLVGPTLKTNINVESWIRGKIPPTLDSDGVHKTFDVKYIDLSPLGLARNSRPCKVGNFCRFRLGLCKRY